jgi:hypothetical protein
MPDTPTLAVPPHVPARWTDDCQGKKDYDGTLVSLSTRYWPRGGSFIVYANPGGFVSDGADPERQRTIPPHAHAAILLRVAGEDEADYREPITLAEHEFTGETQEEVQAQVEVWAQTQYERVVSALRREFSHA